MLSSSRRARSERSGIPSWVPAADRALIGAVARIRMIASATPRNYRGELDRMTARWISGRHEAPQFEYETPGDASDLRSALDALARQLDVEGSLGQVYAARARELGDEAAICASAGRPGLWEAARRRFARRDRFDDDADALVAEWLAREDGADHEREALERDHDRHEQVRTDDERDGRSLLARMREEVGRRKLPVRIVLTRDMASLAAVGDGVVQIATDRFIARRDVERTVLHEIEGHVLPRTRAAKLRLGIFTIGTARGTDDQEGRALALERRDGWLDERRRKELALRHVAARCVERGAAFVETARELLAHRATVPDAVRITARAHRGGGLAREAVYVPALLRVEASQRERPDLSPVLGSGRVAVDAAPVLAEWAS